jgi:hypothetical protein
VAACNGAGPPSSRAGRSRSPSASTTATWRRPARAS